MRRGPVISEVVLSSKPFAADFALVRTLVSVRSFVDQQIVRFSEVTTAKSTNELTSVETPHTNTL